jgi:colanic acid/amylovoran biosynthesis glycosyltransferase
MPTPEVSTGQFQDGSPVAAQYVVTFLKPEMLHIYRQITALQAFRPVVFCQKRENADRFPFQDLNVLRKPLTHPLRRLVQKQWLGRPVIIYRSEARRILAALESARAQVLHIYFGHIGVHLLPLLEICPLPVVVSFHGADAQVDLEKPIHRALMERMQERATLLLVRSESLGARLKTLGAPAEKIRIHRAGIPLEQIAFRQREAPRDGAWHCAQACRLIEKKGLGIAKRVEFPGFLSQEKLHALYAGSHFFLHPSELGADGDQEGVPNSMLEAMAGGLPVVATMHGGIPEAVEHGVSGLLTPERDFAALADSLFTLADDPARYGRMSAAAAARAAARFDLSVQSRVLEACYREAISIRRTPPVHSAPG